MTGLTKPAGGSQGQAGGMSTALSTLSNKLISNNSELSALLEDARKVSIPLIPETTQFTDPYIRVGLTFVRVKTEFAPKKKWDEKKRAMAETGEFESTNGDIYKTDNGQYALHHTKLNEIAKAGGVQIYHSSVEERQRDDKGLVVFISHLVKAKWRSVDGVYHDEAITGTYDYYSDVKSKTQANADRRRNNADALAETKALNRLFRKAIPQFLGSYPLEELKKPFAVPFVIDDQKALLDSLDPDDRKLVHKRLTEQRLGLIKDMTPERHIEDAEIVTPKPQTTEGPAGLDPTKEVKPPEPQAPQAATILSPEEEINLTLNEYRNTEQKYRTKGMIELQLSKEIDDQSANVTEEQFEKASVEDQIKFLSKLLHAPKKQEGLPI
jgi:hypothetical protein